MHWRARGGPSAKCISRTSTRASRSVTNPCWRRSGAAGGSGWGGGPIPPRWTRWCRRSGSASGHPGRAVAPARSERAAGAHSSRQLVEEHAMSVSEPITAITERVARLRRRLQEQELDALLVTNPENRRYLSGFSGHDDGADSAGALVVSRDAISLITDGRYTELAARECPGLRVIHRQGPFAPLAAETLLATGARRIGFEAAHVTVAGRDDLADALAEKAGDAAPPELVATRALVEPLRAVKDDAELAAIERAVAITDATFTYLFRYLRPGMTGQQADALARDVAEAAGHGEHYLHGLGHGLGLEIHESPALSKYAEEQTLKPGMVFSIEPGIYVSGWGGVRIEDTVVLTDAGVRVLTASHKRFALPAR